MSRLGSNGSGRFGFGKPWGMGALAVLVVLLVSVTLGMLWPEEGSRTAGGTDPTRSGIAGTAPATTTATPQTEEAMCANPPVRGFGAVYSTNARVRRLGCPVEQERGLPMGEEGFQNGHMMWRSDTRTIYVLRSDGGWSAVPDSWQEGDPTPSVEQPPAGTFAPQRGFGKVWRESPGVREGLGWALAPERGFTGAVQGFDRGQMVWSDAGSITVLYENGTWERFADAFVESGTPQPVATRLATEAVATSVAGSQAATPVPTPALTATPTATPKPAVPLVIPTATGDCTIAPVRSFGQLYNSQQQMRQRLGCATGPEQTTAAAEEDFEGGTMIWRGDLGHIYVLYSGGEWVAYSDTFKEGEPESGGSTPPAGLVEPIRGFGKVWRENPLVRAKLNWAKEREQGQEAFVQAFERGIMLRSERKRVFVLYLDGNWERFADTYTGG